MQKPCVAFQNAEVMERTKLGSVWVLRQRRPRPLADRPSSCPIMRLKFGMWGCRRSWRKEEMMKLMVLVLVGSSHSSQGR